MSRASSLPLHTSFQHCFHSAIKGCASPKLLVAHVIAGYDEPPPLEEVMAFLATWDQVPKAQLLEVRS